MDQQPGQQQPGGAPPQYSPDRQWWWDGQQWVPAAQAPPPAGPPRPARLPWVWLGIAAGLVVLMGVCTVAVSLSGNSHTANPNVSSQDIARNQATPIPDTPTEVVTVPTATPTPASPPTAAPATPPPPTAAPPAAVIPPIAAASQPPAAPAGCYPLTNSGGCYRPGEFCRTSDHGASGRTADGEAIVCVNNDGWRWEPA